MSSDSKITIKLNQNVLIWKWGGENTRTSSVAGATTYVETFRDLVQFVVATVWNASFLNW